MEVLGDLEGVPVVIASGEAHLPVALSYTAFTIPLSYESFGMKASSIRILFSPPNQSVTSDRKLSQS